MKQVNPLRMPSRKKRLRNLGIALIAPVMLYMLVVMVFPFLWAIYISLTDKRVGTTGNFIGLRNYTSLFTDSLFWRSVFNTVIFTVGAVTLKVIFGMIMALILNEKIACRNLNRALLILPWTIPTLVSVLIWQWIFSDISGVLNYILLNLHVVESQVGFLASRWLAMGAVVLVNAWRGIPFVSISVLAGLQCIDATLYEAARIDGANAIQRFWNVTMPMVKNVTLLATIVTTVWTLGDFEIIWVLTRGGPANGTQILSTLSYTYGFMNMDIGKALAIALISFPPLAVLIHFTTKRMLEQS
ncbi:MAG: sugar ABC transporter permease [Clostridia bacterium]